MQTLLGQIQIAPIVPAALLALLLTALLSALLVRLGFFRLVWHRPLVEVALFCIVLCAVVVIQGRPG